MNGDHVAGQSRLERAKRGQALVPVLFVLMILTSLAVAFALASHTELRASANFANRTARTLAAQGALNYALGALSATSNNGAMYGIVPPNPEADANGWWQIGDAWVKVEVVDTASRLDLNSVTAATLESWPVFQTNTDLAEAIVSWRTPQSTSGGTSGSGTSGAASGSSGSSSSGSDTFSSYYSGLSTPYSEKNAPYETVNELLLVDQMTPTILYGTIAGSTAVTEVTQSSTSTPGRGVSRALSRQTGAKAGGTAGAGASGGAGAGSGAASTASESDFSSIYSTSTLPMSELFTTISRERQIAANGTPRININTASATDLQNIGLTAGQANRLIQWRQNGGQSTGGGVAMPGPGVGGGGGVTVPTAPAAPKKSVRFGRQASGAMPGGSQSGAGGTGTGGSKTGTGGSGAGGASTTPVFKTLADLLDVTGFTATVMQQIADYIAIDNNTYREHVVNINTAPQEVLAAVPGMDTTTLNAILTARQSGQVFQTMGDIYTLQGVSRTEFQAVIDSLTTKASTYIIRIRVQMPGENAVYAVEALAELTDNGPLVLQWREVPYAPGWSSWTAPPTLPAATGASSSGSTAGSTTSSTGT